MVLLDPDAGTTPTAVRIEVSVKICFIFSEPPLRFELGGLREYCLVEVQRVVGGRYDCLQQE
jgi:hypothetical protein